MVEPTMPTVDFETWALRLNKEVEAKNAEIVRLRSELSACREAVKDARLLEISDFCQALDDWGCNDPTERVKAMREFLASPVGLTQYLDRNVPEVSGNA